VLFRSVFALILDFLLLPALLLLGKRGRESEPVAAITLQPSAA
jgi:hypothetical protein